VLVWSTKQRTSRGIDAEEIERLARQALRVAGALRFVEPDGARLSADRHITITACPGGLSRLCLWEEGTDTCEYSTRRSTRRPIGMSCGDGGVMVHAFECSAGAGPEPRTQRGASSCRNADSHHAESPPGSLKDLSQVRIVGRARPRPANSRTPECAGQTGYGHAAAFQSAVLIGASLACQSHDRTKP
jgi:hypothetical protein